MRQAHVVGCSQFLEVFKLSQAVDKVRLTSKVDVVLDKQSIALELHPRPVLLLHLKIAEPSEPYHTVLRLYLPCLYAAQLLYITIAARREIGTCLSFLVDKVAVLGEVHERTGVGSSLASLAVAEPEHTLAALKHLLNIEVSGEESLMYGEAALVGRALRDGVRPESVVDVGVDATADVANLQ